MQKAKRYFNTSGPNILARHYTLLREQLVMRGMELVEEERYFTIWAPRQTGKSTYFRLLAENLKQKDYKVVHINVESFLEAPLRSLFTYLLDEIKRHWGKDWQLETLSDLFNAIKSVNDGRYVLIIDEIEHLNPAYFGQFLHTIRNLYHSREDHGLKSVILVGVSNILGIIEDHASPFNIADNLDIPYFTQEETFDLLHQHELETGQLFEESAKAKISDITANQPGLVNGFAYQLTKRCEGKEVISYDDYLRVEDWYITEAIDKNVSNVLKHARKHRAFVEQLLYTEVNVPFRINRSEIKALHTIGLIQKDADGNVAFWVPLYKKVLYDAFYPIFNGESDYFFSHIADFFDLVKGGRIDFDFLIQNYKDYVKRRSFKAFREKDSSTGKYLSIKEAALKYSFETYVSLFLDRIGAKAYTEVDTGLGKSDILINYQGAEYVIEAKVYRESYQVQKGLNQLAYYCRSISISEGIYLIFAANQVSVKGITEGIREVKGVKIRVYIVAFDEEKDF